MAREGEERERLNIEIQREVATSIMWGWERMDGGTIWCGPEELLLCPAKWTDPVASTPKEHSPSVLLKTLTCIQTAQIGEGHFLFWRDIGPVHKKAP